MNSSSEGALCFTIVYWLAVLSLCFFVAQGYIGFLGFLFGIVFWVLIYVLLLVWGSRSEARPRRIMWLIILFFVPSSVIWIVVCAQFGGIVVLGTFVASLFATTQYIFIPASHVNAFRSWLLPDTTVNDGTQYSALTSTVSTTISYSSLVDDATDTNILPYLALVKDNSCAAQPNSEEAVVQEIQQCSSIRGPMPTYRYELIPEPVDATFNWKEEMKRFDQLPNETKQLLLVIGSKRMAVEKQVDAENHTSESLLRILNQTVLNKPKTVEEVLSRNQESISNLSQENQKIISAMSRAFFSDGIELRVSNQPSNLAHLHSLPPVRVTKASMSFERSPIDNSEPGEVLNCPEKSRAFCETMRNVIAKGLDIPVDLVIVDNLQAGSIKFNVSYANPVLAMANLPDILKKQNPTTLAKAAELFLSKTKLINIMETQFGATPAAIDIEIVQKKVVLNINPEDFDSRGDIDFPCPDGEIQERGELPYFQPSSKWKRKGLRVSGLYDGGNDAWLGMDGEKGEWAVGFHGTSSGGASATSMIATTRFFAVGGVHACEGEISQAKFTKGLPYGGEKEEAIYFTKNIEHCYILTADAVEIAFQCRINPKVYYDSNPADPSSYCTVLKPENIRPYGMCFRDTCPGVA